MVKLIRSSPRLVAVKQELSPSPTIETPPVAAAYVRERVVEGKFSEPEYFPGSIMMESFEAAWDVAKTKVFHGFVFEPSPFSSFPVIETYQSVQRTQGTRRKTKTKSFCIVWMVVEKKKDKGK